MKRKREKRRVWPCKRGIPASWQLADALPTVVLSWRKVNEGRWAAAGEGGRGSRGGRAGTANHSPTTVVVLFGPTGEG
jgi:hypothetical protein